MIVPAQKTLTVASLDLDGAEYALLDSGSGLTRLLGLIATPNGGSVVEARMDGDEEEFWTFSAQVMIATMVAFLTCVMWNAVREMRLFNTEATARTGDVALGASSTLLIRS